MCQRFCSRRTACLASSIHVGVISGGLSPLSPVLGGEGRKREPERDYRDRLALRQLAQRPPDALLERLAHRVQRLDVSVELLAALLEFLVLLGGRRGGLLPFFQ